MNSYQIDEIAKQYTQYDMIQMNTELPNFPNYRTRVLFVFLKQCSQAGDKQDLYALVTSLAQMGLDTHDLITEATGTLEKSAMRSRQLKVLAGDYFSSRFYHLLSQAGQIEMTKYLADAICEVNRLKMNLYLKMKQLKITAEEYIQQSVHIRLQLYAVFSSWMEERYRTLWSDLLQAFTRCELFLEEIERMENSYFRSSWAYWYLMQHATKEEKKLISADDGELSKFRAVLLKYNVKSHLFHMLGTQFQELTDKIKAFESDKMVQDLFTIGEPLRQFLSVPVALEEV